MYIFFLSFEDISRTFKREHCGLSFPTHKTLSYTHRHTKTTLKSRAPISLRGVENYLFELFHVINCNTISFGVNGAQTANMNGAKCSDEQFVLSTLIPG